MIYEENERAGNILAELEEAEKLTLVSTMVALMTGKHLILNASGG